MGLGNSTMAGPEKRRTTNGREEAKENGKENEANAMTKITKMNV